MGDTSLSDALATTDRKPGGRFVARVWYCGDDGCGCSEPQVQYRWRESLGDRWDKVVTVWTGQFRTDHEPGATTELNREAQRLRRHHHDLYTQVQWPWDRGTDGRP